MMSDFQRIDFSILEFIHENLKTPLLDKIMPIITSLANGGVLWIVIAVIIWVVKKEKLCGLTVFLALVIEVFVCNVVLKNLIRRIRPCDVNTAVSLLINRPVDYSFPSGHTAVSFAAATVIYSINKKWGVCAFVLAAAIGFSRLYLYVHFPSDVLAGALLGIGCGYIAIHIMNIFYKRNEDLSE